MNEWTQEELVAQANRYLSAADQGGEPEADADAPSALRDEIPADHAAAVNERTVRYYRAQALLDPPSGWRGRRPLFGTRHLRQLLAVRTLQAAGWTLQQIRAWLPGADAAALDAVLDRPADAAAAVPPTPGGRSGASRAARAVWSAPLAVAMAEEPPLVVHESHAKTMPPDARRSSPSPGDVATTRLADGVYLLIDRAAARRLDPVALGAAISRAGRLIREAAAAGREEDNDKETRRRNEEDE